MTKYIFSLVCLVCLVFNSKAENIRVVYTKDFDIKKASGLISFLLNSISTNNKIILPKIFKKTVIFDLDDYNIKPKIYDKYFKGKTYLDEFVHKALNGSSYYEFLNIGNLKDFQKVIGFTDTEKLKVQSSFLLSNSSVVKLPQMFTREPTLTGFYWDAYSVELNKHLLRVGILQNKNSKNVLKQRMGTLHNGLLAYCITDKNNKLMSMMPVDLAVDNNLKDFRVVNAVSCIGCHSDGVQSFESENKFVFKEKLKKAIFEKFAANASFKEDQKIYKTVVKLATNGVMSSKEISTNVIKLFNNYTARMRATDRANSFLKAIGYKMEANDKLVEMFMKNCSHAEILSYLKGKK